MFHTIYNTGIRFYKLALLAASPFNAKAKLFLKGRNRIFEQVEMALQEEKRERIWFHCASLGEFEQARPVIEATRELVPDFAIILTFFSPSGYEIRKNYPGADHIFYLPLDTASNAQKFISLLKPSVALFAKYEFWFHYLKTLHQTSIPCLSFSAIFREDQVFFKPYASDYKELLSWFRQIFVQDEKSAGLLKQNGINQVTVTGDTRFDRVVQIVQAKKEIPIAKAFCQHSKVLVIGSSWKEDLEVLAPSLKMLESKLKIIVAPHEIDEASLSTVEKLLSLPVIRFSKAEGADFSKFSVLLIDNIGMLSSLYSYAHIAYIGGAFGKGLHNILEAATYGIPVIFGPNYRKFREAKELLHIGGAVSVRDQKDATEILNKLTDDESERLKMGQTAGRYVQENTGATEKIIDYLKNLLGR